MLAKHKGVKMEDKNELSDIILEKDDGKSMKTKRILIIAALLIVIFLIVLIIMKVSNRQADHTKLNLPPTPTQKVVETKKEDDLFKQVPITEIEDKKESFEEMVKSLKEKEIQKQENLRPKIEETKQVVKKVEVQDIPKVAIPPKIQEPIAPTAKIEPVKKPSALATTGVYIQVGATSRLSPDEKFLAKLVSKGYQHRLLPIDVKGTKVTKILIGPFTNSATARAELSKVRSNINKDAFIYRVK